MSCRLRVAQLPSVHQGRVARCSSQFLSRSKSNGRLYSRSSRLRSSEEIENATADSAPVADTPKDLPSRDLAFEEPSAIQRFSTSFRLLWALPWRRFKKDSVLTFDLTGDIYELRQSRFSKQISLPIICEALVKAASDPRIKGVLVHLKPLACGWAKLMEIRRHVEFFNSSGKFSVVYMELGGEKEYYLASAFQEIYVPPSANFYLRGLAVSGTFLRGALDKAGLEPQVRRIGDYKSAGDQLLREEMSVYQKEQLQALLDDIYDGFVREVARSRDVTIESVERMMEEGYVTMEEYQRDGFLTGVKYKDEIVDMLKERLGIKKKKDELRKVSLMRYKGVRPSAFGLNRGKKAIAVVRASGAISSVDIGLPSSGPAIKAQQVIRDIRKAVEMKNVAAIVLRVDSPGGEALGSDLIWREIRRACKDKPIVASMADLAASGGYYMAMATDKIIAEELTITGSIGVVLTKLGFGELYQRIGIGKEIISKGRYAELFADNRSFNEDEDAYWTKLAEYAYTSFRDKAAESRGISSEQMQQYAQGRVWSGVRAVEVGLVDAIGGIQCAIAIAKQCAELKETESVKVIEISRAKSNPLEMLQAAGAYSNGVVSVLFLVWGIISIIFAKESLAVFSSITSIVLGSVGLVSLIPRKDEDTWEYTMDQIEVLDSKSNGVISMAIMDLDPSLFLSKSLIPLIERILKGKI